MCVPELAIHEIDTASTITTLALRVFLLDFIIWFLVSWLCCAFLNLDHCIQLQPKFGLLFTLVPLLQPLKSEPVASISSLCLFFESRKYICLIINSVFSFLFYEINLLGRFITCHLVYCIITEGFHFASQVLGRTIDLRSIITQRMNKIFRENIDFLLERFENGDLCGVVVRMFYFCLYNLIAAAGKLLFWNHFFLSSQIRNCNNCWIFWSLHTNQYQDFLNWILTLLCLVRCKRIFRWFLIQVASLLRFGTLPCYTNEFD